MALAVLVVVFLISRLVNLLLLPIFADEAIYILWAQLIWQGKYFIPLTDGKTPLFMWLLAPLLQLINDPLLAGRLLSVAAGLAGLIGVYVLTKKLFNQSVALLASALVIFQPFLFFYDRLSLVDSLVTALAVWSFYTAWQLFQRPSLKLGLILGSLWLASLLTKPSGLYPLILTPLFLLAFPFKSWKKKIKQLIFPGILAGGIGLGLFQFLRFSDAYFLITQRSAEYLRPASEILTQFFQFFPETLAVFTSWLSSYFSLPGLLILIFTVALAVKTRSKAIGLLALWILVPFLSQIVLGRIIRPRYLLPIIPFLLIIVSWTVLEAKKAFNLVVIAFVGLAVLSWLNFDFWLLTNPVKAPLHSWEKEQYFYEWSAGFGLKEITQYLKQLPKNQQVLVGTEGSFGTLPDGLMIEFNRSSNIKIIGLGFPQNANLHPEIVRALDRGETVYLVANEHRFSFGDPQRLKLIAEYPRPVSPQGQQKLMFYQVLP